MFEDRRDAGERLAKALKKYKNRKVLVLGIPRGGVEVAYHVAKYLDAEFSMLVARKLPYPYNPEAGFGAIAEDNSIFMFKNAERELSKKEIEKIIEEQKQEVKRRVERLRKGKPLPEISGREVILIDDGLAMGSTMRTAIMLCKNRKAERIVVAVPVSGRDIARDIGEMVDEIVVLEKPLFFYAVAQVYNNWYDVSDEEVLEIMKKAEEIFK
ncbi:MAG TPA: phosphoribosyltransferase family protein [Nitrospinota bacterium]|nr:phosphoribosyltransferase family protein [Nitrospinota bacterium]